MRKRRWILCSLFALMLGAACMVVLFIWLRRDRGHECFDQLSVGMPEQEAVALLTRYGFSKKWAGVDHDFGGEVMRFTKDEEGRHAIVVVFTLADRCLTEKVYDVREEPSFFDRLLRKLINH